MSVVHGYAISHPLMYLLPHLSSDQHFSGVFPLSPPMAFQGNAVCIPVVFCIFAIWCCSCMCLLAPLPCTEIIHSVQPHSLFYLFLLFACIKVSHFLLWFQDTSFAHSYYFFSFYHKLILWSLEALLERGQRKECPPCARCWLFSLSALQKVQKWLKLCLHW